MEAHQRHQGADASNPLHGEAAAGTTPLAPFLWLHVGGRLHGKVLFESSCVVLGRGDRCDVVIDDPKVSRDHLELRLHGGAVVAADLGSSNGTTLNGQRLTQPTRLRDGDTLVFGSARLALALPAAAGAIETELALSTTAPLSDDERAVAQALVAQFREPGILAPRPGTRAEIALALHLSERTVQRRLDALVTKLRAPGHVPRDRPQVLAQRILELGVDLPRA